MKPKSLKILRIITAVCAALYLAVILSSFFDDELSSLNLFGSLFLFLFFLVGVGLSWTRVKITAVIFMVWTSGIWIVDFIVNRGRDTGMLSIMAVPVLVLGALFLLEWFKASTTPQPSIEQQWKFALRVLLVNYAVLYTIVVISEITAGKHVDYFSMPFILFPVLLLVFLLGFASSWKREFQAGLIFLFWYAILIYGTVSYSEFRNSGPWIGFGIVILLQGIFYIKNYLSFKSLNKPT